jgi:hypothetical protein
MRVVPVATNVVYVRLVVVAALAIFTSASISPDQIIFSSPDQIICRVW